MRCGGVEQARMQRPMTWLPKTCCPEPAATPGARAAPGSICPCPGTTHPRAKATGTATRASAPGGQESARAPGLPRTQQPRNFRAGGKKAKGGSLHASCQGECFHLRPWYFSPGACTKSPQLLSLFFCALQGSTAGGGMQKANPSLFCTSKYLQPSSPRPSEGHSIPSTNTGHLAEAAARCRVSWCRAPGQPVLPGRGLHRTPAQGFVHLFPLPLSTGKQVPHGAWRAPTIGQYGISWHVLGNSSLQLNLFCNAPVGRDPGQAAPPRLPPLHPTASPLAGVNLSSRTSAPLQTWSCLSPLRACLSAILQPTATSQSKAT